MQNIYLSIRNIITTCINNNKSYRIRLLFSFGLQNIPLHNGNILIR